MRKDPAGVVIVDTGTVGYRVFVSLSTYTDLPSEGEGLLLHTVTVVRDDAMHLYGFLDLADLSLFNLLVQVKGVGPKLALTILGGLRPVDLKNAIAGEDAAWIATVPGVGKKTAERIVLELKDKVEAEGLEAASRPAGVDDKLVSDAVSALVNLGYRAKESKDAVDKVLRDSDTAPDFDILIREVLKVLGGKR
jgi:Holliday junction DNA helicase RuvA